ncbi:hypothetical protein IEQ34_006617 [Dendrobium chrysotoxum]|uniref:60S ribosomal protein L13a n=1 Tax=Dendrobium chrysotoxum TaxID=161865 RepID=A0AAV7H430_DENCH|nr:hypothetical protein IEQ34_006617 [Dendrobium chrysotoxum]
MPFHGLIHFCGPAKFLLHTICEMIPHKTKRGATVLARLKHMNTRPFHGPIHFCAPAKFLWHTIYGMIPHKTKRGATVLARLKAYEGIPPPFTTRKRV